VRYKCKGSLCLRWLRKKDLEPHYDACEYILVDCEKCQGSVMRKELLTHSCIDLMKDSIEGLKTQRIELREKTRFVSKENDMLQKMILQFLNEIKRENDKIREYIKKLDEFKDRERKSFN
jgi:hypothetical protein